ncbi:MAG: TonB-dependent receptor [Bacteroidales bacterium]|nr:TonB-dependent receptor [Bacteroidales bacterium]
MKKMIFALLAVLAMFTDAHAQNDAHIIGHVIDRKTQEHVPYIYIRIIGTNVITSTDASGHYKLTNIPQGNYELEASGIGYITEVKKITVSGTSNLNINFEISEDNLQLEQVVVTGNRSETKKRHSATLVNVVNREIFELVSASSLADGLNFQPGVRVENDCQNCGFTQVRINGLDGHYSQILMNSKPVFSALAGVYGLEHIPATMIDRVEVMRGGGSALFGSSAIGGTINIITKDPVTNSAELSHNITSIGNSSSFDNNTTANASVVNGNGKSGLFIYGQSRKREAYDDNGDGFTEIGTIDAKTLGINSFYNLSKNSKLRAEYSSTNEFRRGGDQLDIPAHQSYIAEQTDHNINAGNITFDAWSDDYKNKYNIYAALRDTKRDSYYGSNMDPNAYGSTHDLVVVGGGQYVHSFTKLWFMPAEFTAGVEYNYNYLNDVTIGYDHDATQKVNIYSAFLQNEWRTDKWGFLLGARIDKHSLVDNAIISPRANIRYNPSKMLNFRLSYSTGFRAPQAFDEDFHIAIVGGERVVTTLADDLKEESSNSFSFSTDWYHNFASVQTNVMMELFYTELKDVFTIRMLEEFDAKGNQVQERYNGSGATVAGINLEGKAVFSSDFMLQAGLTYQRSRYKQPEEWSENPDVAPEKRMFRTPDIYGYFTMQYTPTKKFSVSLTGTYSGEMLVQHMESSGTPIDVAVKTPSFFDANLKVSKEFQLFPGVNMELNGGMMNIFNSFQDDFDSGVDRDSGYIYGPMMPRSLYIGVKLSL